MSKKETLSLINGDLINVDIHWYEKLDPGKIFFHIAQP